MAVALIPSRPMPKPRPRDPTALDGPRRLGQKTGGRGAGALQERRRQPGIGATASQDTVPSPSSPFSPDKLEGSSDAAAATATRPAETGHPPDPSLEVARSYPSGHTVYALDLDALPRRPDYLPSRIAEDLRVFQTRLKKKRGQVQFPDTWEDPRRKIDGRLLYLDYDLSGQVDGAALTIPTNSDEAPFTVTQVQVLEGLDGGGPRVLGGVEAAADRAPGELLKVYSLPGSLKLYLDRGYLVMDEDDPSSDIFLFRLPSQAGADKVRNGLLLKTRLARVLSANNNNFITVEDLLRTAARMAQEEPENLQRRMTEHLSQNFGNRLRVEVFKPQSSTYGKQLLAGPGDPLLPSTGVEVDGEYTLPDFISKHLRFES